MLNTQTACRSCIDGANLEKFSMRLANFHTEWRKVLNDSLDALREKVHPMKKDEHAIRVKLGHFRNYFYFR